MRVYLQEFSNGEWRDKLTNGKRDEGEFTPTIFDIIHKLVFCRLRLVSCKTNRVIASNYVRRVDNRPLREDMPLVV